LTEEGFETRVNLQGAPLKIENKPGFFPERD
jgi:hypothetical protein